MSYMAARRPGRLGRFGEQRGEIRRPDEPKPIMILRSERLAQTVTRLLNDGREPMRPTSPGEVLRYTMGAKRVDGAWAIWVVSWKSREPPKFGPGIVAMSKDFDLAKRVAGLLNEIDPG
jgi:hypothetical protein